MAGSLGRRPQATVFSVEDLVERVRRGEVRVPTFQRRLKWRASDVQLLFDSIARGYPVGSLLFWKKEAPADSVSLGPVTVDAPASRDALWVVDGQQRITSLVGVLLHPDPVHQRDDFALGVDLESGEFVKSRVSLPKSWMPLNIVLDTTKLLGWLDGYELRASKPGHVGTAHRIAKAVRDFQLPAYVVDADDEALVRDVFGRLNAAGRKLTQDEVFDALSGSEAGPGASTLKAISESIQELGFGKLERAWILKAVLAVAGMDFTQQRAVDVPRGSLKELHAATERALKDVVVFLKRDAGIAHASLLPYSLPLAILARFFHRNRSPRPRSRELLARWVWRGAIMGQHQGQSIPEVRRMLAATGEPEESAVQSLLRLLPPRPAQGDKRMRELAKFSWRTARTKLEANALAVQGPRDLTTGVPIDVGALLETKGASAFREIFPTKVRTLARHRRESVRQSLFGTLANRIFHSDGGESGLGLLGTVLGRPDLDILLATHLVPEAQLRDVLRKGQEEPGLLQAIAGGQPIPWQRVERSFRAAVILLRVRTDLLSVQLNEFLEAKARWDESDRPSIESLTIPDEEPADG